MFGIFQERKKTKEKVFLGRTSCGHPGVMRADVPGQKLRAGPRNLGKSKHLGADDHDPKHAEVHDCRGVEKELREEELWADLLFLKFSVYYRHRVNGVGQGGVK